MLMLFLDRLLGKILVKSFRNEALGDLWEANYEMRCQGKHRLYRGLVVSWRSILLIYASIQISRYEKNNSILVLSFSQQEMSGALLAAVMTSMLIGFSSISCLSYASFNHRFRDEDQKSRYAFPPSLEL